MVRLLNASPGKDAEEGPQFLPPKVGSGFSQKFDPAAHCQRLEDSSKNLEDSLTMICIGASSLELFNEVSRIQMNVRVLHGGHMELESEKQQEIEKLKEEIEVLKAEKQSQMAGRFARGFIEPRSDTMPSVLSHALIEEDIEMANDGTAIQDATRTEASPLLFPAGQSTHHELIASRQTSGVGSFHDAAQRNNLVDEMHGDMGFSEEHMDERTRTPRESKNPRKHQCNRCSKRFTRATTLREHVRTHDDDRCFKCKHCSKSFVRKKDQKRHEEAHDNGSSRVCMGILYGEGREEGWGCRKRFSRSDGLRAHWQTKTGQKCLEKVLHGLKTEIKFCYRLRGDESAICCKLRRVWNKFLGFGVRLEGCQETFQTAEEWIAHIECATKRSCDLMMDSMLLEYADFVTDESWPFHETSW